MNTYSLVINKETGNLDLYDRNGSRVRRSFSTPEAAKTGLVGFVRGPKVELMLKKFASYQKNPQNKTISLAGVKKISELPKGTKVSGPNGEVYVVGAGRGRPPGWVSKMLKDANP